MQQNYQDAIAIVAKYGKPDLFVTYTCNQMSKRLWRTCKMESVLRIDQTWYPECFIYTSLNGFMIFKDHHVLGVRRKTYLR